MKINQGKRGEERGECVFGGGGERREEGEEGGRGGWADGREGEKEEVRMG